MRPPAWTLFVVGLVVLGNLWVLRSREPIRSRASHAATHALLDELWLDMPSMPVFRPCLYRLFSRHLPPRSSMSVFGTVDAVFVMHHGVRGTHADPKPVFGSMERQAIALRRLASILPPGWEKHNLVHVLDQFDGARITADEMYCVLADGATAQVGAISPSFKYLHAFFIALFYGYRSVLIIESDANWAPEAASRITNVLRYLNDGANKVFEVSHPEYLAYPPPGTVKNMTRSSNEWDSVVLSTCMSISCPNNTGSVAPVCHAPMLEPPRCNLAVVFSRSGAEKFLSVPLQFQADFQMNLVARTLRYDGYWMRDNNALAAFEDFRGFPNQARTSWRNGGAYNRAQLRQMVEKGQLVLG